MKAFDECIRINPTDATSYYGKAKVNFVLSRTQEAIECLKSAFLFEPSIRTEFEKDYPEIKSSKLFKRLIRRSLKKFIILFNMQNSFYTNTELIGLIGYPIKQSFSPFIHNIAAEITGSKIIYLPFEVHSSNLKKCCKRNVALGLKGFNVTVPHKVKVVDYVNKLSEEAAVIGSVNTVVNELGKLIGYNTDVNGVDDSLIPYKNRKLAGMKFV